jgi:hypothetical protein
VNVSAARPPEPAPAIGEGSAHGYDLSDRRTAARIQQASPHWLVMWGPHSRRFFAFPLFRAPPGTIVTASGPDRLLARMRQAEAAATARPRTARHPAAAGHGTRPVMRVVPPAPPQRRI